MRRSITTVSITVTCGLAWAGCQPAQREPADVIAGLFAGGSAEWIDMSYSYDESTIFWPTAQPFELEVVSAGMSEGGYYYAANNFCSAEHGGTHLDAPIHFYEGRQTADQVPLQRLIGPAVVVDVSAAAGADSDYQVSVEDLEAWEAEQGAIPEGAILLLHTGWGARWPDAERYLGTALKGPEAVPLLHFPGLHPDAARWLVENRRIDALGIDTPSIDYGQSTAFESHRILYAENIPAFENVAALERLPAKGAYVIALPMKIAGGSGGPLRVVGVIPGSG
ncbi:MAG: cyclase family protein [Gemmatimonadota bacterium]|nr:MAG: cyclase family protein [Gemmatimonadota bacterium]